MRKLLVAGGHLDPNIGRLLRRVLQRKLAFVDLLTGPKSIPSVEIDLGDLALCINGKCVEADSVFLRHDAFWQDERPEASAQTAALNWHNAIRGWARASGKSMFNLLARAHDNDKLENLILARTSGLAIPKTLVTNDFRKATKKLGRASIVKPVAGGQFTRLLSTAVRAKGGKVAEDLYPRFAQEHLKRPEMRVYIVGDSTHAFSLESDDLDYRERHNARIGIVGVPLEVEIGLRKLCGLLRLDFAAADFMRSGKGDYTFLEINTQPMFVAFDIASEGKLVDSILDFLVH